MLLLVQYTLIFASVLVLVALGGCFSEHSGVINIGLEGIMVMGALGGALMMKYIPAGMAAPLVILLVVLASVLIGMIFSMLLGVAAIKFNADQTLVGTALNLLGPAAAVVLVRAINTCPCADYILSGCSDIEQSYFICKQYRKRTHQKCRCFYKCRSEIFLHRNFTRVIEEVL